ncbi:integrase core domain-containing protein [Rhodovulum sulfidophilum]
MRIQPGRSRQNAYGERGNRTVRHEWSSLYSFESTQ